MTASITLINDSNLEDIISIHLASLPNDTFSQFGRGIIEKYYKNTIKDPQQTLIGVRLGGGICGFSLLTRRQIGLGGLFFNWDTQFKLIRILLTQPKYFINGILHKLNSVPIKKNYAEIAFIAVLPEYQNQGFGKLLIRHLMDLSKKQSITHLMTKTSNKFLKNYYIKKYNAEIVKKFKINNSEFSYLVWANN